MLSVVCADSHFTQNRYTVSVVMPRILFLSVVFPSDIMLSVVMLSVIIVNCHHAKYCLPSIIMLSIVMLRILILCVVFWSNILLA
jgi:hypothetical protein